MKSLVLLFVFIFTTPSYAAHFKFDQTDIPEYRIDSSIIAIECYDSLRDMLYNYTLANEDRATYHYSVDLLIISYENGKKEYVSCNSIRVTTN